MRSTARRRRLRTDETVATEVEHRASGQPMDHPGSKDATVKHPVETPYYPAYVRVEGSVTQNMGDFNSVRVGVCIERPCRDDDEVIESTYSDLSRRVDTMIERELTVATGGTPNDNGA